jgi:hypothetical protein
MPKIRLFLQLLAVACVLGFGSTPKARAETIRSFDTAIRLQKDTTLDVVETIVWDYEGARRHGIFRLIPIRYNRYNGSYTIYLDVISVNDEQGRKRKYRTSRKWNNLEIKIGDADVWVSGVQTYVIRYKVRRAVNFFKDANGREAPEVYWNATGDEWDFPIGQATARFYPPAGVAISDLKTTSFQGRRGSTQPANVEARGDHVLFYANNLSRNEGLTIVVGLPAGSVVKPTALQNLLWILADWWPAFLLPIVGAGVLLTLYLQGGRDVEGGQAVEWNPPTELSPAQVGTLVDEHCDMADIVSTMVDLAARGYLIIEETESTKFLFLSSKDYTFIKRADAPPVSELQSFEREFFNGVFGISDRATLSSLKNKFYTHLPTIKSGIYNSLVEKRLFNSNPESTRTAYVGAGIVLIVLGIIGFFAGQAAWGIGLLVVGVLCVVLARAMPSKTATGSKMLRQCLGFQRYVELAEKERIKVLADKDPTLFGRLLPYAMVLGVADQWAEAFKDLITEPPDWYVGPGYGHGFVPYMFVNDLGRGMNSMGQTFSSQPQSTGGSGGSGFSGGGGGGGFGGGGGGSW